MSAPPPTERARELIRQGADVVLDGAAEWFDEVDVATLSAPSLEALADDPEFRAEAMRANRTSLLHWARSNVEAPGEPVAPSTLEPLEAARNIVRRGYDASALDSYRLGQNVAWQRWMQIVFDLTRDPDELREVLDITGRSVAEYVDATIQNTARMIDAEFAELVSGRDARNYRVVRRLLDGSDLTRSEVEHELRFPMHGQHLAAVIWTTGAEPRNDDLRRVVKHLQSIVKAADTLTIPVSTGTHWAWFRDADELDRRSIDSMTIPTDVQVAIGSVGSGFEGFRRSLLDAADVQRLLARLESPHQIATHDQVAAVLALSADPQRARSFVSRTLGALESGPVELRETALAYLSEGCHSGRAAARLFTHRNTVLRRLERCDALLPRPLAENPVHVGIALEMAYWGGWGRTPGRAPVTAGEVHEK
ncbi:PucR family transcriptional regulator [Gordonia sp. NPDC003376]